MLLYNVRILDYLKSLYLDEDLSRPLVVDRILFSIGMLGAMVEGIREIYGGDWDPINLVLRLLVFTISAVSLVLSLSTPWGKRNSSRFAMVELFVIVGQISHSCYIHNFPFAESVLMYMLVPIGALFMVSPRWAAAFFLFAAIVVPLSIWNSESLPEEKWRLAMMLAYVTLGGMAAFSMNYRMEKQLVASNARFRILAEFSSDIIAMHDLNGNITYASPSTYKQAGYAADELIGTSAFALIHPADREKAAERYRQVLTPPFASAQIEYRLIRKDGTPVWVEAIGTPVLDKQGRITHVVTTTRDISKRKHAENERIAYNAQLVRTNRELDEFAYVVSHDLKAPLRGIATLTDFIEEDMAGLELPDQVRNHFRLMRDRTNRLERLINDILAYSRAGRTQTEEEPINMEKFLREMVALQAPPAGFSIVFEGDYPTLVAPRVFLEQVFANLINNAYLHHDRNEGRIVVTGLQVKDGWEFSVCDDGPGIAPQHHERIFEVFHQLHGKEAEKGTGIGLAVVRKVLNIVGGGVRIEACKPRGTCFVVFWPCKGNAKTARN